MAKMAKRKPTVADRLARVLREIVTYPGVSEVLAPRGSLGSLLDQADLALRDYRKQKAAKRRRARGSQS